MYDYKKETRVEKDGLIFVSGMADGTEFGMDDFPMSHYETPSGKYVGGQDTVDMLKKYGIVPETISNRHRVCSIGFSEKEQKWYGWSHRAIYGFGIGHVTKEGDCSTESGWVNGIDPTTNQKDPYVVPVGFEAKTLEDAKRVAIAFASSVS